MRFAPISFVLAIASTTACNPEVSVNRNDAPVAELGDDIVQAANLTVFLDGRSSFDSDGDTLEFYWSIDQAPAASNRDEQADPFTSNRSIDAGTTTFQPDATGVYVIELLTYDGKLYSDPSYIVVNATEPDEKPVANAGNDQTLAFPGPATIDGGQSQDPLGGLLSYEWFLVTKPYSSELQRNDVDGQTERSASFTPDVPGEYTLGLIVCSPQACSEADEVTLDFSGENRAPTANAGGDSTAEDCRTVPFDCSASTDPDGDLLFYWWTVQAAPEGSDVDNRYISNQNAATPDLFFDVAGEYQLSCSVFDGQAWSRPDTITVDVDERSTNDIPLVDVGEDQLIDYGVTLCKQERIPYSWSPLTTSCDKVGDDAAPINITATASDPDGDEFTLEWEVTRDSSIRLKGRNDGLTATVETPSFQPSELGTIEDVSFLQLTATDCTGGKGKDELEIVTTCKAELK